MIVTKYYKTRKDGVILNRTYSDAGYYITRDGVKYSEAVDPADLNREYTETEELIKTEATEDEQKASRLQAVRQQMGQNSV